MRHSPLPLLAYLALSACSPSAKPTPDETGSTSSPTSTTSSTTSETLTSGTATDACYQADAFLDLRNLPGPGDAYPEPQLSARCEGEELIVESNGMPHYEYVAVSPAPLAEQTWEYHIPLVPVAASAPIEIPLLGDAGVVINGMPIYGPNEAAIPPELAWGDPVYNGLMDDCLGHTGGASDYHYHALLVECFFGDAPADEPSPILGFAFDGYPIYGPLGCLDASCAEVVEFKSGYEQTAPPTTDAWDKHRYVESDDPAVLDACNGRTGPDGTYRYHATRSWPYVLGCYHGEPTGRNDGAAGAPG